MKSVLIALAALTVTTGAALAAPGYGHRSHDGHGISPRERVVISHSAANLAQLKRRVWADGRLSGIERFQLRNAERRHAALIARARRS